MMKRSRFILFLTLVLALCPLTLCAVPYGYGKAIFKVNVPECLVMINGKTLETGKSGTASIYLKAGSYEYEVTSDRYYYKRAGSVVIYSEEETTVPVVLKPSFGSICLNDDENGSYAGANVFIDAIPCGKVPCKISKVLNGKHSVRVSKRNYLPYESEVTVEEEKDIVINVSLKQNYALVSIKSVPEAEISVDGEKIGRGEWTGPLEAGVHIIESNMPYYVPGSKEVEVTAGSPEVEITLPAPQPQYGSIKLECSPSFFTSSVFIDGQISGKIPLLVEKVTAGKHDILVEKKSGNSNVKLKCSVTVIPGQTLTVTESMLTPSKQPEK